MAENKQCQLKQDLQYHIFALELQLDAALVVACGTISDQYQEIRELCDGLVKAYGDYAKLIGADSALKNTNEPCCTKWMCQIALDDLRHQWTRVKNLPVERQIIASICEHYRHFPETLSFENYTAADFSTMPVILRNLILTRDISEWLNAFVAWVNTLKGDLRAMNEQLALVDFVALQMLHEVSNRPDFLALSHTLFQYQQDSECILLADLHPERLESLKLRLHSLYFYLESFQKIITRNLYQFGVVARSYWLRKDSPLPGGVSLNSNKLYADIILTALKQLRIGQAHYRSRLKISIKWRDVLRAYKFWFNPNQLIDAVMVFWQQSTRHAKYQHECFAFFKNRINLLYRQLDLNFCIELYGYFSNKDTKHLMWTLRGASHNRALFWSNEKLNKEQADTIKLVDKILAYVMQQIRSELALRGIETEPYAWEQQIGTARPGRRNRKAIYRVLDLYKNVVKTNSSQHSRMENLFESLEKTWGKDD